MTAPGLRAAAAPARAVAARRSSALRALLAWAAERFPARTLLLVVPLYAACAVTARALAAPGPVALGIGDLAGAAAVAAFLLVLRVLDEHKDAAADAVAHPDRVLQRGLVTLAQLRAVAAVAVAGQLAVTLARDGGVGAAAGWWAAAAGWSALMAVEFGARDWLRARLVPYALTHMLVMPLLAGWAAALALAPAPAPAPAALVARAAMPGAALAFAAGLALEIGRKLRAPADERPMADSYTAALGVPRAGAALLLALALVAAAALGAVRASTGALPGWAVAAIGAPALLAAACAWRFVRRRDRAAAGAAERASALAVVGALLATVAAVLVARGVRA